MTKIFAQFNIATGVNDDLWSLCEFVFKGLAAQFKMKFCSVISPYVFSSILVFVGSRLLFFLYVVAAVGFEPTLPKGLVAQTNSNTQFKLHVNFCSAHDCAHDISCLWAAFLVFTHVMRRPCWCTKQWQNVAPVLHDNRIIFSKDFFRYCSAHQHGRRDVT